jgi:hypothetical protein
LSKWRKLGLLVSSESVRREIPWSNGFTQAPNAVVLNDKIRVYFTTRDHPDKNGNVVSLGAFVDFSGLTPSEVISWSSDPTLSLGALGEFDEFGTYPISVVKTEREFIAYYGGWTRCESVPFNVAIGRARSIDGISFSKVGLGPVLPPLMDEPFVVTSPKIRHFGNQYVLAYTAGRKWFSHEGRMEIIYKLRIAFSDDGINWNRLGRDLIADTLGPEEAQASPDITFSDGKYHMFFCYRQPTDFRKNSARGYKIGYAWSEDLINWSRDDSKFELSTSAEGWDSEMVAYPSVFHYKNELFMLYLGNEVGRDGIGLARLEGSLS